MVKEIDQWWGGSAREGAVCRHSRCNRTRCLSWLHVCAGVWSVTTSCSTITFLLTKRETRYGGSGAEGQWGIGKGQGMADSPPLTVKVFPGPRAAVVAGAVVGTMVGLRAAGRTGALVPTRGKALEGRPMISSKCPRLCQEGLSLGIQGAPI